MIDYTTVKEDGFTRACFTVDEAYFEVQINDVVQSDMQEFLVNKVEEMQAMQDAES